MEWDLWAAVCPCDVDILLIGLEDHPCGVGLFREVKTVPVGTKAELLAAGGLRAAGFHDGEAGIPSLQEGHKNKGHRDVTAMGPEGQSRLTRGSEVRTHQDSTGRASLAGAPLNQIES